MDIATWQILGIGGGLLLALSMLKLAWRGRRVGENACCANCDYLLVGLPETSDRCPECGTTISLTSGLNVRSGGSHKRSVGWVLVCLALLTAGGWWEQRNIRAWFSRPAERKPNWLLFHDIKSAVAADRELALNELVKRDGKGHIAGKHGPQLVDAVIAAVRTPAFGNEDYYDWLIVRRSKGGVNDTQWKQFFDDHPPSYVVRPVVSSIEPFQLDDSGGLQWGCTRSAEYQIRSVAIDGQPVAFMADEPSAIDLGKQLPNLPAGKHVITLGVAARLWGADFGNADQWTGTVTVPFEYRTDGQSSVERLTSEADKTALIAALKPTLHWENAQLMINFSYVTNLPLCHDLYIRDGERLVPITLLQGGNICGTGTGRDKVLPPGTKSVDLVLKPNPMAAAKSAYITKLVDKNIVLKDVPIAAKRP